MSSISPTNQSFGGTLVKNRCPSSTYLKTHKYITFSYAIGSTTFQQGMLGDADSYLEGTVHLRYEKPCFVKNVILHFRGSEKTSWYKAQARTKAVYAGEQVLADKTDKIWDSEQEHPVTILDIPFKILLPYNLPETVNTEIGQVNYTLRVAVSKKGNFGTYSTQVAEIQCPLKRILLLDSSNVFPFKFRGESRSGIDYNFILPPNKNFNLGTYVTIPMRIRFLRQGVSVERVEIALKTCMDFRCENPNETRHIKETSTSMVIPRQEIKYVQSNSQHFEGECIHTINLFVPRSVQPTYSGRFISVNHQFCVKFCLWGADNDFQVEESVRVANIHEKCVESASLPQPPSPQSQTPTSARQQHRQPPARNITTPYPNVTYDDDNESYISSQNYDLDHRGADREFLSSHDQYETQTYQRNNKSGPGSRRPSQASSATLMMETPPPFPYNVALDGYDQLFSSYGFNTESDDLWLREKLQELAIIHQHRQHNIYSHNSKSPVYIAPKSPPMQPPPPTPPISVINNLYKEMSGHPMNSSKLPPYENAANLEKGYHPSSNMEKESSQISVESDLTQQHPSLNIEKESSQIEKELSPRLLPTLNLANLHHSRPSTPSVRSATPSQYPRNVTSPPPYRGHPTSLRSHQYVEAYTCDFDS
ncbi:219_t:CDS:1 [Acaulospora morrowiae]|uniref:219_t:CDS:1 n=1 Tax=Acaulospora morrowiae TaxID=94023 RepID=A0A9N9BSH3_9GLOM|nr:219_t:CDS:1 [Acaulospora morrowiae]